MSRIYGKKIDLDSAAVHDFFELRGKQIDLQHPLTSVLYQNHDPDLAVRRDEFEKTRMLPLLELDSDSVCIDIGCGIGRWADVIKTKVRHYHGVDFSASLIDAARAHHSDANCTFQVLAAQDAHRSNLSVKDPFSQCIVGGVFLYLNDDQLHQTLRAIVDICADKSLLYIREPIALNERLTLDAFESIELGSQYHAIYRCESEIVRLFEEYLIPKGFRLVHNDYLYEAALNNRSETVQKVFILKRS